MLPELLGRMEGIIWEPAATEDSDQLAGSFSPPHNKRDNEQSCLFVTWIGFLDEHIPSEPAAMLISEMIKKLLN